MEKINLFSYISVLYTKLRDTFNLSGKTTNKKNSDLNKKISF
jgi:hypothetical protein